MIVTVSVGQDRRNMRNLPGAVRQIIVLKALYLGEKCCEISSVVFYWPAKLNNTIAPNFKRRSSKIRLRAS